MLIDFHCHTKDSFDAYTTYDELLEACLNKNISAVAITEHDKASKVPRKKFLNRGITIIEGCEFTTDKGAHLIGLFIKEALPPKNDVQSIINYINEQKGLIYIPHPFKDKTGFFKIHSDYKIFLNHCRIIEIVNGGIRESAAELYQIKKIARDYNLTLVSGSDSHKVSQVGYYVNDYKTNKTDLYDIVKNESPIICVNSNFRKPPRKLNLLQKTTLYQFLILKINSKLKRNIKKFTYKLLKKKNKSEVPNYTKVDL